MREIRLRGFAKGQIINVGNIEEYLYDDNHYDFDMKLMLSTGLKDVNEVEIFEGDIIEDTLTKLKYEVIWDRASFALKSINERKGFKTHEHLAFIWDNNNLDTRAKVIGHIYE